MENTPHYKTSHRTSLAGLDDITALGVNGFDTLKQISERLQRKDIVASLEKSKRYLKLHYQNKCDVTSEIASHNPLHALSHPDNLNLQCSYTLNDEANCKEYYDLCHSIDSLSEIAIECKADEDTMHELETAKKNIIDYLKHLIRDVQLKKAKEYAFANLKENTAFWLRDFCQNVLPKKFRESQQDYYGKKGISLHVDVFLMKQQNLLKKHVYFTVIQRCEQGISDTLILANVVLDQF